MSAEILISYTSCDRAWAHWIGVTLRDNGFNPHVHEWEVGAGENISRWMDETFNDSDYLIGVFTNAYVNALYSRAERWAAWWAETEGRSGFFVPVEVEEVTAWPLLIRPLNKLSIVGLSEHQAERALLEFLKPRVSPKARPPFPGLSLPARKTKFRASESEPLPARRPGWPTGSPEGLQRTTYRECNYDLIAEWYDHWYDAIWNKDEPYKTVERFGQLEYRDVFHDKKSAVRILDCACGTGNSFVAFQRAGYEIFGMAQRKCLSVPKHIAKTTKFLTTRL